MLPYEGKFYVVEHVPVRVCQETAAECFSPDTVDHIHMFIKGGKSPDPVIETPVFEYL